MTHVRTRLASSLAALGVGATAVHLAAGVVPSDLVVRPEPGQEYRLEAYGRAPLVPLVRRLDLLPCAVPTAVPCDPARREAARRDGDLVEIEPGTPAGLLRVDSDDLHHPAMRIHVAGGPHAGLRGFVSRWHLRREGPDWIGRLGLALFGAGAGLAAGAVARAALVLAARPESGTRQRA